MYITYKRKSLLLKFLSTMVWVSLSTFTIIAKNALGQDFLPLFEALIFLGGLVGVRVAYRDVLSLKQSILIDNITETLFLVGVYTTLLYNDLAVSAVVLYLVVIANSVMSPIRAEKMRSYEDVHLRTSGGKRALKHIRKHMQLRNLYGGSIGAIIAIIALTYLKMDIIVFTKVVLIGNVVDNLYEHYMWTKYLRRLKES